MLTQRKATAVRPVARFEKLVVTETADEVLLYDTDKHHIHHLNATTAAVWRLCDGKHTIVDLAREAGTDLGAKVDEATVRLALTKLDDAGLLKQPLIDELRMSRMSRRTFMQRAGVAGAIAVPAIVSTTSHAFAAWSQTTCGKPCASSEVDCVLPGGVEADCSYCLNGTCQGAPAGCGAPCGTPGNPFDGHCQGLGQGNICNRCVVPGEDGEDGQWYCGGNNFACGNNGSSCGSDNDCVVNAGNNNVSCTVCQIDPGKSTGVCVDPPEGFAAGFAAPAMAQEEESSTKLRGAPASIGVTPSEGAAGDPVTVTISGFAAGDQVSISWDATGSVLTVIETDAEGNGSQDVTIPQDADSEAKNSIVASNLAGDTTASAGFTVTAATTDAPSEDEQQPELPTTGTASITVVDNAVGPVNNFRVALSGEGGYFEGDDGGSGMANIADVPAGSYTVTLLSQADGATLAENGTVNVPAGDVGTGTVYVTMPAPETEVPETEVPETEVPEIQMLETQVPETQVPETQVPETQVPETQVPETQVPETQVPETQVPETQVPDDTSSEDPAT